jgi:hypothetical protein
MRGAGTAVFVALLVLRLPLWMLPGPGRDEAAYHYWVHHPEPAYAPLLQWTVWLSEAGLGHSLWALRLPVLVLGFAVLVLNEWRLATARTPAGLRLMALLAVAFSPWQGFVSSILHPDNFLLAALLCLVLSIQRNRLWLAVASAVAAVLAKPTGILFLPVLWFLSGRLAGIRRRELWTARSVLIATALGLGLVMDSDLIAALADFGRLSPSRPWLEHGLAAGGSLLYQGGPLLLGMAWFGVRQRVGILRREQPDDVRREAFAALMIGGVLIAFFLAALLLRGQFKANWVLPAVVVLWPVRSPRWLAGRKGAALAIAGVALVGLGSLGQAVILARPEWAGAMERALVARNLAPRWATYATQAGEREAVVSSSRTWTDHLREFADMSAFAQAIEAGWEQMPDGTAPVSWIVASDYGLAFQLHWCLGDDGVQVAVPGDGIFHRTWTTFRLDEPEGPLLVLSEDAADRLVAEGWTHRRFLAPVPHPVTGSLMRLVAVSRHASFDKELGDETMP